MRKSRKTPGRVQPSYDYSQRSQSSQQTQSSTAIGYLLKANLPLLFVLICAFLIVFQSSKAANLRYQIRHEVQVARQTMKINGELRVQIAQSSSAERIEKLYRMKYGFVPVSASLRVTQLALPPDPRNTQLQTSTVNAHILKPLE